MHEDDSRRAAEIARLQHELARLREERDEYLDLLEHGDAKLVLDGEFRYVFVNRTHEQLVGRGREELLGRCIWDVWPEASGLKFGEVYRRVMRDRVPEQFEEHFDPLDLWVEVRAFPTAGGGLAAFVRQINDRKAVERSVRESEERYRQLADSMPQIVWTARTDGTVDYYNRRVSEFLGFERRADGTWSWRPALHPEDLQRTADAWNEALRTGEPYEIAHRIRLASGTYHWYLSRSVPVRDAAGRVVKWYGTATDIDAQKRAEDALRESDRRKDEFLGMLSHELRNPLAPITNSLFLLDHVDPGGERARRAREVLSRQVGHLTRLVDDLLDVTRIARGRIELKRRALDLAQLLRATCDDYRMLFDERGVELGCPPRTPIWVDGDETRLGQVVGNLLQNAAKFTPRGGHVDLMLAREGDDAVIRVRDSGNGVPPPLMQKIFEPFTQAEQTLARSEGGLGLGLALVKGLVEMHGGSVAVANTGDGGGAEFTVRLPVSTS